MLLRCLLSYQCMTKRKTRKHSHYCQNKRFYRGPNRQFTLKNILLIKKSIETSTSTHGLMTTDFFFLKTKQEECVVFFFCHAKLLNIKEEEKRRTKGELVVNVKRS